MKKKKEKNLVNREIEEITNILDKDYFHVSVTLKDDGSLQWYIYYKNLPSQLYLNNKNEALLTSENNTVEDIYKLKERFEQEKYSKIKENYSELKKIDFEIYNIVFNIKNYFWDLEYFIQAVGLFIMLVVTLWVESIGLTSIILLSYLLVVSYNQVKEKKLDKKIEEETQHIIDKFIKEKIKREGLYFVEKLRGENYAINQKARKTTNKIV